MIGSSTPACTRRDVVALVALSLLGPLAFINRAVHLDENTYIAIARHVSRQFWFPQDFAGQWFGIPVMNFGGHSHPDGLSYFIALVMKVAHSQQEWCLRLGMEVFVVAFAVGAYFLARRFTGYAFQAALLMMVTPAVLVFSPTLMPDLPMTALWLWGAVFFLSGLDEGKTSKLFVAGICLVAATWISFQAVVMCVLLGIYAGWKGIRRPAVWVSLLLPFLFVAAYWYAEYIHYGYFGPSRSWNYYTTVKLYQRDYFEQKAAGMLTTLGGTTVFCLAILWAFLKGTGWKSWLSVLVLAGLSVFLVPTGYTGAELAQFYVFALAGVAMMWIMAEMVLRPAKDPEYLGRTLPDRVFLGLWCFGVIAYTVLLGEFSAARYVLSSVPPLVIGLVLWSEKSDNLGGRFLKNFLSMSIVLTWILALAIAYADYQFVGSYRNFAGQFFKKYGQTKAEVWVGTEAGLRYYMNQEGARTLVNPNGPLIAGVMPGTTWGLEHFGSPREGDLLVRPVSFLRYDIAPELELSSAIEWKILTSNFPLRTWNPVAHAGLHGTNVGLLPFAFSTVPFDEIEVTRFNSLAAGFERALKVADPDNPITETYFVVQRRRRPVIQMPPNAQLTFTGLQDHSQGFELEWGLDDSIWAPGSCQSVLSVRVRRSGETPFNSCAQQQVDFSRIQSGDRPRLGTIRCSFDGSLKTPGSIDLQVDRTSEGSSACPMIGLWNLQLAGPNSGH
ncbi:MAG: glycosyltransferase family 39 protein [Acidobacteriia bacterium]|nr:glycosyltransferase family 39 protein [Terriglobia bacterium]